MGPAPPTTQKIETTRRSGEACSDCSSQRERRALLPAIHTSSKACTKDGGAIFGGGGGGLSLVVVVVDVLWALVWGMGRNMCVSCCEAAVDRSMKRHRAGDHVSGEDFDPIQSIQCGQRKKGGPGCVGDMQAGQGRRRKHKTIRVCRQSAMR